jgi:hypothetical protein
MHSLMCEQARGEPCSFYPPGETVSRMPLMPDGSLPGARAVQPDATRAKCELPVFVPIRPWQWRQRLHLVRTFPLQRDSSRCSLRVALKYQSRNRSIAQSAPTAGREADPINRSLTRCRRDLSAMAPRTSARRRTTIFTQGTRRLRPSTRLCMQQRPRPMINIAVLRAHCLLQAIDTLTARRSTPKRLWQSKRHALRAQSV